MSESYRMGISARLNSKNIHFNPYRNLPEDGRHFEWERGWKKADRDIKRKIN